MPIKQAHYEEVLADCSDQAGAITLLKQYRPYLEMIPSMRRSQDSLITIPLPLIRLRGAVSAVASGESKIASGELVRLPCEVAILMCDPEWKIKTGVELFIFIHQPQEDFSHLLGRWRQTQIWLDKSYEWIMPNRYQHILSEAAEQTRPLFVVFPDTPDRIKKGLRGACLPFVTRAIESLDYETDLLNPFSSEMLGTDE
jgi:hypothetical protein